MGFASGNPWGEALSGITTRCGKAAIRSVFAFLIRMCRRFNVLVVASRRRTGSGHLERFRHGLISRQHLGPMPRTPSCIAAMNCLSTRAGTALEMGSTFGHALCQMGAIVEYFIPHALLRHFSAASSMGAL